VRQILTALKEGRVNFASYLPKLRARREEPQQHSAEELWTQTLSFLARHSRESPRFEVALAMCLHFVPEGAAATAAAIAANKTSSLFEVSQQHSQVVVAAQYLSGWCCSQRSGHTGGAGVGAGAGAGAGAGLEVKNADASRRRAAAAAATAAHAAAATHFAQAAAEGYAAAQYELALCYRHGRGAGGGAGAGRVAEVDLEAAARLFERAAEQGHIGAQLSLARCYGLGEGVSAQLVAHVNAGAGAANSTTEAKRWLCRATYQEVRDDGGDLACEWRCYLRAAACFEQGREVEQDLQEAQRLYKLYHAASEALAALAARQQGPRDDAVAAAATAAEEQFLLGECYEFGRGVEKDEKEAARLYRLSSEQGNADGQWRLGMCYYYGRGVAEKDLTEAVRLFRLCCSRERTRAVLSWSVLWRG